MSVLGNAFMPILYGPRIAHVKAPRQPTRHSRPAQRPDLSRECRFRSRTCFAAEGFPCFAGSSRRLPADPWEKDGPLVATLRRQLGVIMGKTHMVEFAFGGTGINTHWGAPYNPWDTSAPRSPGGSSSGAGVSLLEGSALVGAGQRHGRLGSYPGLHDR